MFKRRPIETVADAQRRAKRKLPAAVYTAVLSGLDSGVTLRENIEAFERIGFLPRVGSHVAAQIDLRTSLLGQDISIPVVISPAAAQAIHPECEVAVARAAARSGTAIGQSNFASSRFEDVAAANPKAFFQLYWSGTKDMIEERIERFRRAGATGLILTLDGVRMTLPPDWGKPPIPQRLDLMTLIRYAPMGIGNPGWLLRYLRHGSFPRLTVPNFQQPGHPPPTFVDSVAAWRQTPRPTWRDVRWLRDVWSGPFMVKGILSAEDARRAVDAGATAIGVSNHGGSNLDTTPSPLRFLPGVIEAVGDQAEVTFDSGIRRGADVVKVLALGAKAALVGRSWLFGLAADGERGVFEVLESYREGIERTLIGLGKSSIHELSHDDLIVPDGYFLKSARDLPLNP